MLRKYLPWIGLAYMGVAWGLSFSLAKLATADGTTPLGIAFWQSLSAGLLLLVYVYLRRRRLSMAWPAIKLYIIVALLGTTIPSVFLLCCGACTSRRFGYYGNAGAHFDVWISLTNAV